MKNLKMMIALLLAVAVMCFSVSTAYAEEYDEVLKAKMEELMNLCEEVYFAFGINSSLFYDLEPGQILPNYLITMDTTKLTDAHNDAIILCRSYLDGEKYPYYEEFNLEIATERYDNLYEVLHNVVIDRVEVEELVAICEKENNDNGYYDEQSWNDFKAELGQAKELLTDESIIDQRVTSAFYELMYQYNLLCSYNKVYCDIDGDGVMTVMDATYIQRYLVGFETFNSSQVFVSPEFYLDDINITNATTIQKRCADQKIIFPHKLRMLIDGLEESNPASEEFKYDSIKCNVMYYGNGVSYIHWDLE